MRYTVDSIIIFLTFVQVHLKWCFVLITFRILHWFVQMNLLQCPSLRSESQTIHPHLKRVFLTPLYSNIIFIFCVSQHCYEPCMVPSMIPLCSGSSLYTVYVHKGFRFAGPSLVDWRLFYIEFHLGSQVSGFQMAIFLSVQLFVVQGFAICIIWWATCCRASWASIWIVFFKLFIVKYCVNAQHMAITVSSSGTIEIPRNCHIVWQCQSRNERNPGIAVNWSFNPILAFITTCQPTLLLVLYQRNPLKFSTFHSQYENWPLLDSFALDFKVLYERRWILH